MHIILLRFGKNKSAAPQFMEAHNNWIANGIEDGIFHCVGSLKVGGGAILALGEDTASIERRVQQDPFVEHAIVDAEILELDIKRQSEAFEVFLASS